VLKPTPLFWRILGLVKYHHTSPWLFEFFRDFIGLVSVFVSYFSVATSLIGYWYPFAAVMLFF